MIASLIANEVTEGLAEIPVEMAVQVAVAEEAATPKEGGRASKSWLTKIGEPIPFVDPHEAVFSVEQDARRKLDGYELGDGITVYNWRTYIIPLEFGHSDQAPRGFVNEAIEEGLGRVE